MRIYTLILLIVSNILYASNGIYTSDMTAALLNWRLYNTPMTGQPKYVPYPVLANHWKFCSEGSYDKDRFKCLPPDRKLQYADLRASSFLSEDRLSPGQQILAETAIANLFNTGLNDDIPLYMKEPNITANKRNFERRLRLETSIAVAANEFFEAIERRRVNADEKSELQILLDVSSNRLNPEWLETIDIADDSEIHKVNAKELAALNLQFKNLNNLLERMLIQQANISVLLTKQQEAQLALIDLIEASTRS